jgi:hypothetical protein
VSFTTPLHIHRIFGSRKRQLLAPLTFRSTVGTITAPEGFIYNGVSFPVVWGGDGEAAAAIHDFMYSRPDLYTRAQADTVLREALEAEGMNAIRRNGWWAMVRAFGWAYHEEKDPHENDPPVDHSPGA